jgi:exodeoxyribonuclease-1
MTQTFYWHDYETFGTDPSRDRPSQFAGIRTDMNLNVIGKPLMLYCKPAADFVPHPEACLITGITPQLALEKGVVEAEFIRQIHHELAAPGTCGVGYNSIRFDDEVSRYTLYRNFYDPYSREWQHGNSRWDIIDMLRLTYALRPEGINWPSYDDGTPSFRLEDLTEANGLSHEAAHDALSDVYATIAVARLVREKQPRLYDYVFRHRGKNAIAAMLDPARMEPVLHVSSMLPAANRRTALVVPLAKHPTNKNGVLVYNLGQNPEALIKLGAEQVAERLFTPVADLPEGVERIALKTVHLNKCPLVATPKLLSGEVAERLQIDVDACYRHLDMLRNASGLAGKLQEVFGQRRFAEITDPDRMLYSGGFASDRDKTTMTLVREATAVQLAEQSFVFEDGRYNDLLLRYRARNWPESLTPEEAGEWREFCYQRLTEKEGGGSIVLDEYFARIQALEAEYSSDESKQKILQDLLAYGDEVLAV